MLCARPFRRDGGEFGCGQCMPCRINYARMMTSRLVLESLQHKASSFVTLTKDAQHEDGRGCVSVREAQLFLKRLRERVAPFRYYVVGEYGSHTWRPHYHALLFGVRDGYGVRESWPFGFVHVSGVGPESIAYVAGYSVKRMTRYGDVRLGGRCPEFGRMSLKPGIGARAADRIGEFYLSQGGAAVLARDWRVGRGIRHGRKIWPLGRYLVNRIKSVSGVDEESARMREQLEQGRRYLQELDVVIQENEDREGKRLQVERRVAARYAIAQSKKGVGL